MRPRGMIDWQCGICHRKYGHVWVEGAPPRSCPHCGSPPTEKQFKDMNALAELVMLLDKNAEGMTPAELQRARIAAGLTLDQAAKILGVTPDQLNAVELGHRSLDKSLAVAIDNAYHLAKQPSDPKGQER